MAAAFGVSVGFLEAELARFIAAGRISATIDRWVAVDGWQWGFAGFTGFADLMWWRRKKLGGIGAVLRELWRFWCKLTELWQWQKVQWLKKKAVRLVGGSGRVAVGVRRVRRFEVDVEKKIWRIRSSIEGVVAFSVQVDGIVAVAVGRFSRTKTYAFFFHQKYRFADQKSPLFPLNFGIFLSKIDVF
jgi:hypothetical protein